MVHVPSQDGSCQESVMVALYSGSTSCRRASGLHQGLWDAWEGSPGKSLQVSGAPPLVLMEGRRLMLSWTSSTSISPTLRGPAWPPGQLFLSMPSLYGISPSRGRPSCYRDRLLGPWVLWSRTEHRPHLSRTLCAGLCHVPEPGLWDHVSSRLLRVLCQEP